MSIKNINISIIITIHNAEKYIKECLDSVVNQTFSAIEILCIDGGSVDQTPQILIEYAERDKRIRIINDKNCSYGHKVNRGIGEARGEYVAVLESDDLYELHMLNTLYEVAEKEQVDYVNADFTCFFDINGFRFSYLQKMYQDEEYGHVILNSHDKKIAMYPRFWTGLFRRDFLVKNDIKLNESEGASFQDMSFRFLTSLLAERTYHVPMSVYLYRIDNMDSSMHDCKKTVVIADEHEFLRQELLKRGITNSNIWFSSYEWKYMDFRGNMRNLWGKYRQELFDRYRLELENDSKALMSLKNEIFIKNVEEMFYEQPDQLLKMIEEEALENEKRKKRIYDFLYKVTSKTFQQGIVVFGCGKLGMQILKFLEPIREKIICLIDNNSDLWSSEIENYKVLAPNEVVKKYPDAYYLIVISREKEEAYKQLDNLGVKDKQFFL